MKSIFFLLFAVLAVSVHQSNAQAVSCGECELVVGIIEEWVEANNTLTEMQTYLDALCATIFSGYEQTCDQIANQGLAQVVAWLKADESPQDVCTSLSLCTSSMAEKQLGGLVCDECHAVVNTIEVWLDNTNNQDEVITAIEVICTGFSEWDATCDSMIEAGIPEVVNWIDTNENSTVVCQQLGSCGNDSKIEFAIMKKVSNVGDYECDTCTSLVGYVESWVESNYSISQIEQWLEYLCAYIPDYKTQCDQVILSEVPSIVASIEANESPLQVCTQLSLCSSNSTLIVPTIAKPQHKTLSKLMIH